MMSNPKKQKLDPCVNSLDYLIDCMCKKVNNEIDINIYLWNNNEKEFIVRIEQNDIEYIKNNYQSIDPKHMITCFKLATVYSTSFEIVDFLIDCFKINIYDYFPFICRVSSNVCMIKYLMDKYNDIDSELLQLCLRRAGEYESYRRNKSNIEVIKYLVEEKNADIDIISSYPCNQINLFLEFSAWCNIDAIIYLLQHSKNLSDKDLEFLMLYCNDDIAYLKQIVAGLNDYDRINHFLRIYQTPEKINNVYQGPDIGINPLMYDSSNRRKYGIKNPFLESWVEYQRLVDKLTTVIPINYNESKVRTYNDECPDFSKYSNAGKLFQCNDIIYYGDRTIMYESMILLRDMDEHLSFNNLIVLTGNVPKYIVNHYINASYTGEFRLANIKPSDLSVFIKFIDQYPTTIVSVDRLEEQIIQFFDNNKLNYCDFDDLKNIFIRYRLKYLYLHVHNKFLTH